VATEIDDDEVARQYREQLIKEQEEQDSDLNSVKILKKQTSKKDSYKRLFKNIPKPLELGRPKLKL
jgi:hypothetical protein